MNEDLCYRKDNTWQANADYFYDNLSSKKSPNIVICV